MPASDTMAATISSRRASIWSAILCMAAERSAPDMRRQGPLSKASRAAAIAASTWAAEACCNEPMILPVAGFQTSSGLPSPGAARPPISISLHRRRLLGLATVMLLLLLIR